MKKNKFATIYAIFASIFFILTLVYFSYNLYSEYSKGYLRTKVTFDELALSIKENPQSIKIPDLNDYAFLEIMENGHTFYKYPTKESESAGSSDLIKNHFTSVKSNDVNYFINADMYLLRPASIRFYARNSFLVVLIITVITIILLIYCTLSEKNDSPVYNYNETDGKDDSSIEEVTYTDVDIETDSSLQDAQTTETVSETTANIELNLEPTLDNSEVISETPAENSETTEAANENAEKEQVELPSDQVKPIEITQDDNNPYGLFSPKSGIGWESYLITRLDNELNRAISSEFDLAVFVIKITNIEKDNEKLKNVCDYLTIQFQFKDLLFEYKDDCIVAIKISMGLDDAINLADKLHNDIEDITAEECYIGISTRTIRIISGERLLQEADEALKHAQDEKDAPIIAFRANADKYRKYMETSN